MYVPYLSYVLFDISGIYLVKVTVNEILISSDVLGDYLDICGTISPDWIFSNYYTD